MTASPAEARSDPRNAHLPLANQPETILGVTITFLSLAIVAASLRLWIRFRDHLWGWDDAFVFLAVIASVIGDSIVCLMPYDGLGLHFYTLSDSNKEAYFKHVWGTNGAYCASTTFIKLAILIQYLRLFAETATSTTSSQYRLARRCTWAMGLISAAWGIVFFILALFPCRPIAKKWIPTLEGTCVGWGSKEPNKVFATWAAHATTNMVIDVAVLLLPLPFLGMLRVVGKSRVGLIVLFAMGSVVAVVSIGRLVSLCVHRAGTVPIPDMSYYTPIVYIFSVLEVNIAILCASIPIFWPMISSFASDKILVVNEVIVLVEDYSKTSMDRQPNIGLADQAAFKSSPDSPGDEIHQFSTRSSTISRTFDRTKDSSSRATHMSKSSVSSSINKIFSRTECTARTSEESHRNLYKTATREGSLTKSEDDWFADVGKEGVDEQAAKKSGIEDPFRSPRLPDTR